MYPCKRIVENRVTWYNSFKYLFLPMQRIDTFANTFSVAKHGLCPSNKKGKTFYPKEISTKTITNEP
jgi:hypothetical protein